MGFKLQSFSLFVEVKRIGRLRKNAIMDWIEQIFHVSPDAGNGSLELLFVVCPIAALLLGLVWLFWIRRRRKRPDDRD
jgi:hypothetical protein